jgi:hypothetical protein
MDCMQQTGKPYCKTHSSESFKDIGYLAVEYFAHGKELSWLFKMQNILE